MNYSCFLYYAIFTLSFSTLCMSKLQRAKLRTKILLPPGTQHLPVTHKVTCGAIIPYQDLVKERRILKEHHKKIVSAADLIKFYEIK